MSRFILMLTNNDVTVADALASYDGLRDSPLHYVGFKDVGLLVADLKRLARRIRADGRKVMFELVATSEVDELASVEAAVEIGVDYLLGGRHVEETLKLLRGSAIKYFPFAGAPPPKKELVSAKRYGTPICVAPCCSSAKSLTSAASGLTR
jgi:hypothetical protein